MSDDWDLSDPDERHLAAGEYVLGTLDAQQKARFEALLAVSHDLQNDVARWREHLQLFNDQLDPRLPPAEVWRRIASATGIAPRPWWQSLGVWRTATATFAVAALALGLLWTQRDDVVPTIDDGQAVYVVLDEQRTPGWIISASEAGELYVQAVQPTQVGAQQTGELWLIADETPISLGLLPSEGRHTLAPSEELRELLMTADLAVSVEPEGGAPEGQPTGPIIDSGRMTPVRGGTFTF